MAKNDDGFGCVAPVIILLWLLGAFIEWLGRVLGAAWTATASFFSNLWISISGALPLIGQILGVVAVLFIGSWLLIKAVEAIAGYQEARRARLAEQKAQELAAEKNRAYWASELGQNRLQRHKVKRELKEVKDIRTALVAERDSKLAYRTRMRADLREHGSHDLERFESYIENAGQMVRDKNRQIQACDELVPELTIRLRDLDREKTSLIEFGTIEQHDEKTLARIEKLKSVGRFLGHYRIETYAGSQSFTLKIIDKEGLDELIEEWEMRREVEAETRFKLPSDRGTGFFTGFGQTY